MRVGGQQNENVRVQLGILHIRDEVCKYSSKWKYHMS